MRIPDNRTAFLALHEAYGNNDDDGRLLPLVKEVKARRHLTPPELEALCRWKSARPLPLIRSNSPAEVEDITRWVFATSVERVRIEALLLLRGVSWPMASAVLHWFHPDPYPVLDVRALWSLGHSVPSSYSFPFWWNYVVACRSLARRFRLPMRTVDRALWQYSKANGGPGTAA